ncbi:hypothetical protein [Stenotrophomonas sp. CFBP8980]|uniref:hypothetical protein n=1 Tax=Stenotrophomonas sp. CFBP8980 TaxID=3096523 RepID=UPI002A6B1ADE|nr:hypothetical protein [Stenotrophomonas sp. CFBP8980]MDY1034026.1 hypothetical protein [Stenotrophomonas sp. CFBP8980]
METNYPLSAERLYSLIGDKISEFPPHFIERLERKLEEFAQLRPRGDRVVQLQRVPSVGSNAPSSGPHGPADRNVAVPFRTLLALGTVLEILHAVHVARPEETPETMISDQMVEGLIVCGREMVESVKAETWGKQ